MALPDPHWGHVTESTSSEGLEQCQFRSNFFHIVHKQIGPHSIAAGVGWEREGGGHKLYSMHYFYNLYSLNSQYTLCIK